MTKSDNIVNYNSHLFTYYRNLVHNTQDKGSNNIHGPPLIVSVQVTAGAGKNLQIYENILHISLFYYINYTFLKYKLQIYIIEIPKQAI